MQLLTTTIDRQHSLRIPERISRNPNKVPLHCQEKQSIELVHGSSLPNTFVYRRSILENEEIHRKIQYLIDKGHIRPISSPCGSPIVLVPKKDRTWHMCINYRALNKISVKNIYPLPWIDKPIDNLKGDKLFMKINLKSGYHQIPIESTNVWKMAFKTKEGLFESLVMPFGLTNAPATFMIYMDDLLRTFIGNYVIVYLNDILIFNRSWEEHVRQLQQVFDSLQQHQL